MNDTHDLGYLKGRLEALERAHDDHLDTAREMRESIKSTKELLEEHVRWEEGYHQQQKAVIDRIPHVEQRLENIAAHISTARLLLQFLKALGLTIIFIVTLKLGDIRGLWQHVFQVPQ